MVQPINRLFSIAPMMEYTHRPFRRFMRLLTSQTLLYTEMVTSGAILHGDREKLLGFDPAEHPLALQVGGSDPKDLAACARIAEDLGYDEINLNVGCPSDRVQAGRFGACLMKSPDLVAECVSAMRETVEIPVTVKTRLGVDNDDSYDFFKSFIDTVAAAGCDVFIIHARKAWLKGLSPKENRTKPPLQIEKVLRIKKERPDLTIILNGELKTSPLLVEQYPTLDGFMIGRHAIDEPYAFAGIEVCFGETREALSRYALVKAYLPILCELLRAGENRQKALKPLLGVFHGEVGAKRWRRLLTENIKGQDPVALIENYFAELSCGPSPCPSPANEFISL